MTTLTETTTDAELCTLMRFYFYPRDDTITVRMERNARRCRVYATGIDQAALGAVVLAFRKRAILRVWGTTEAGEVFVGYDEYEEAS